MTDNRPIHIGVYADVDLNIIDGSSIWLVSLCSVLSRIDDVVVDLVLKAPIQRSILTQELVDLEKVRLSEPLKRRVPAEAVSVMQELDGRDALDVIIVRGRAAAIEMLRGSAFAGRVWAYLTDIPQTVDDLDMTAADELLEIIDESARVLCQTEWLRAWFSSLAPDADRKMLLLPPMVPPAAFRPHARPWGQGGLRLLYAGKFAPSWGVLESIDQVQRLADRGVEIELVVAGDKVHDPPDLPNFSIDMRAALESSSVDWRRGVERRQVFELLDEVDVALSLRSRELDSSRELSTKVLEYCAAGVPVIANRTLAHLELFGNDYPLLVDTFDEMGNALEQLSRDPASLEWISNHVRGLALPYSYDVAAERLGHYLRAASRRQTSPMNGRRILIAGHDLKFVSPLAEDWIASGAQIAIDHWAGHGSSQSKHATTATDDPDLILCEWMLGNAAHYSKTRPESSRLVVRFHRMELETKWPSEIKMDAVDSVVFVSEHIRTQAVQKFGIDPSKTVVIPNAVDADAFQRPKLPGSEHTLALVGFLPSLKRLDRALDLLALIRKEDDRFRLAIRGPMPQDVPWVWSNPTERAFFERMFERIEEEPLLGAAVSFDGPGPDMASWLMQAGYILSPSDVESFHLALVEGMASGAIPVVWQRDGAHEIVSTSWIQSSTEEAANWILSHTDSVFDLRDQSAAEARDRYSTEVVLPLWHELFEGVLLLRDSLLPYEEMSVGTEGWASSSSLDLEDSIDAIAVMTPYRYADRDPDQWDRDMADRLLDGQFSPSRLFEPISWDLPPDWSDNPLQNNSWDFHRHSLEWLEPVIRVAAGGSDDALDAITRTVTDWITRCSSPPGPTRYAWSDHVVAVRSRLLLFLVGALARAGRLDDEFGDTVLRSLLQHGSFLADERFYVGHSNHSLEMDASLMVLASALRNLPQSSAWRATASNRLSRWLDTNFSSIGTHLEQSPGYHLFVSIRLLSMVSYLKDNGFPVPQDLQLTSEKSLAVWPFMRRPDGSAAMIGDTPEYPRPVDWRNVVERLAHRPPRAVAPEPSVNPRANADSFFVDPEAGYAIFADQRPSISDAGWTDTLRFHLTIKCREFESLHRHDDMGSFVLWAWGAEWIVDSGYYSMEANSAPRKYMRSARAHNVVVVDDEEFEIRPNTLFDRGRTLNGDFISLEHVLPTTVHTRTAMVNPSLFTIDIEDRVTSTDGEPHTAKQLFHVHPRLEIDVLNDGHVLLKDDEGHALEIVQDSPVSLSQFSGDHGDRPIGWFSSDYMKRVPSPVLSFESSRPGRVITFSTGIRITR